jgi:hypothetical protein
MIVFSIWPTRGWPGSTLVVVLSPYIERNCSETPPFTTECQPK